MIVHYERGYLMKNFLVKVVVVFIIFMVAGILVINYAGQKWQTYYGICLSSFATIFLGVIALYQNDVIRNDNKLRDKRFYIFNKPNFEVRPTQPPRYSKSASDYVWHPQLAIENISENDALDANIKVIYTRENIILEYHVEKISEFKKDTEIYLNFRGKREDYSKEKNECKIICNIECFNRYGDKYEIKKELFLTYEDKWQSAD